MNYKKFTESVAKLVNYKLADEEVVEEEEIVVTELEDNTKVYSLTELDLGVQLFTDELMETLLVDGDYVTIDGVKFSVIDTVVGSIDEVETEEEEEEVVEEEMETETEEVVEEEVVEETYSESELVDGSFIYYDGELEAGIAIFSDVELSTPVEDAEYTTVKGEIIMVVDGKVETIKSIIEENAEYKKQIDDMNDVSAENEDLKLQVEDLIKQNELLQKTEINLKAKLDNKPAVSSLLDTNDDIKNDEHNGLEFRKSFRSQLKNK